MEVMLKMSQLDNVVFVGPNDTPISTKLVERLKRIQAVGFDISSLPKVQILAPLMADAGTLGDFTTDLTLEDYPYLYAHIIGRDEGKQVTPKPKAPLGPPLPEDVELEQKIEQEDLSQQPETYSMDQIQKMRQGSQIVVRMRHLFATDMSQMWQLMALMKEAGFRINDRMAMIQALQLLRVSPGPFAELASALSQRLMSMNDVQYKGFLAGDVTSPTPAVPPAAPEAPAVPTPAAPPPPPAAPAAPPVAPETPSVPAMPTTTQFDPTQGGSGQASAKSKAKQELSNSYDQLVRAMPPGINAVGRGDSVGINVFEHDPRSKRQVIPTRGGTMVVSIGEGGPPYLEAVVVGKAGPGQLAVRTFPQGAFEVWDVLGRNVHVSSTTLPKPQE